MASMMKKTGIPAQQQRSATRPVVTRPASICRSALTCKAAKEVSPLNAMAQKIATAGAAALMTLGALSGAAVASEFDIIAEDRPSTHFFVDDANVLSRATRSEIDKKLGLLEIETGYRVTAVTVRKLEFEPDTFAFADKIVENWYPTAAEGDKKGVVLIVTAGKEGAVVGGASFLEGVSEPLVESLVTDNIPIFSEQEKYNQCMTSTLDRIDAKLKGNPVPEAPTREDANRGRTYKTKEEVEKSKTVTSTVVVTLLIIAVVVPMLQYYGYTARE